tara:strand:+ start:1605 stop:1895 length:291 start_codon:yes stop_codon:yes gene_type:complete
MIAIARNSMPHDDHEVKLTSDHWEDLKDRWAEIRLDSMDPNDMEQFVYQVLRESLDDLSPTECIRQFTDEFDRVTVDEVIRDITAPGCQRFGSVIS